MMNAAHAYARTSQTGLSPREAEAAVLIKAASRLQACRNEELTSSTGLNEALMFNQRVWTVLASAVADPANPLPDTGGSVPCEEARKRAVFVVPHGSGICPRLSCHDTP